jgi:hypothetical protein
VETQIASPSRVWLAAIRWSAPIGKTGILGGMPARSNAGIATRLTAKSISTRGRHFKAKTGRTGGKNPGKVNQRGAFSKD